jgi:hypothetical protein
MKRLITLLLCVNLGCASVFLGRRYEANPRTDIKIGYDQKSDVIAKMGPPHRTSIDSTGQEILTYVWADGRGGGEQTLIAINKNGVVYLVEVYP